MRRLVAFLAALALAGCIAKADFTSYPPSPPPWTTPACANSSIPSANTVSNTSAETAFSTQCLIKSGAKGGEAINVHVQGVYSAGSLQNATGRVKITNNASIAPATDTVVVNTGAVGGLANATNQEWWGDLWITFQSGGTSIDVQGILYFQSGANQVYPVPLGNTATFPVDPTKDLILYLTVQWGAASASNSMQLRQLVAK